MTEIMQIRSRSEITIPKNVREWLGVKPFDWIGFDLTEDGQVLLHRIIPRRMKNNTCVGGDECGKDCSS